MKKLMPVTICINKNYRLKGSAEEIYKRTSLKSFEIIKKILTKIQV